MNFLSNNKFKFFFTIILVVITFTTSILFLDKLSNKESEGIQEPVIPVKAYQAMEKFEADCICGFFETEHKYFAIGDYKKLYDLPSYLDESNTTVISIEFLANALNLSYEQTDTQIIITDTDEITTFDKTSTWVEKGDNIYTLSEAPVFKYGQYFVPLRQTVEEILGYGLFFDNDSKCYLLYGLSAQIPEEMFQSNLTKLYEDFNIVIDEEIKAQCFDGEEFTITFYFDSTVYGNVTACGNEATYGTIAADKKYAFGTKFYIPLLDFIAPDCIFTVEDRGGLVTGNHLDVYLPSQDMEDPITKEAFSYGRVKTTCYRFKEFEVIKRH